MKRPTLRAIAELADVSVSTVSRFLRDDISLRAETEQRIRAAMKHVGYDSAKPLMSGDTTAPPKRLVIGLIIPNSADGYSGTIMDEVVKAAASYDMDVLVTSALESPVQQAKCMQLFASGVANGIITSGQLIAPQLLRSIIAKGVPVIIFDDKFQGDLPVDCVMVDNYSGAYQATSHLIHHGHQQIAFVGGIAELHSTKERLRGWRDALARAGIDPDGQIVRMGEFSEQYGQAILPHLVELTNPPTAVFAASDRIAIGIMMAARQQKVSVPGDLSVVGFDDIEAASLISPRLTTVRTPLATMARNSMKLMVERMADLNGATSDVIVPVALTPGETVAPPMPARSRETQAARS